MKPLVTRALTLCVAAMLISALATTATAQDPPPTVPPATPPAAPPAPPPPRADGFTGTLDDLAAKFPCVHLSVIGKSAGGRPLRAATVLCGGATSETELTFVTLVVAGLDGVRSRDDTAFAMDLAALIAERAASLPAHTAVRFIVDGNPDAAASQPASRTTNDTATDDDQDGANGEDPPDDVNGDGEITWMRIPDAAGEFSSDDAAKPGSPLERADPAKGRRPAWRVAREGKDDDGDRLFNEDGAGGVDLSRNFTIGFEEHVPVCGQWPASEPETRAIMDHLLADERIAVVYEIGGNETCAAHADAQWTKLPDSDLKVLEGLRAEHGKGAAGVDRKPQAPGGGSLGAAATHQLGRLWMGRAPLGRTGAPWPADGATWPLADDVEWVWTAVVSPVVPAGTEILTLRPRDASKSKTRPSLFADTPSSADFLALLAKDRAQVAFDDVQTSGEAGVLKLSTRLLNKGRLPTHTQRGVEVRGRRPLNVRISIPGGAALLAGEPLVQIERLAGGARSDELRFVVRGKTGEKVTLTCTAPDGGEARMEVEIP